VRPTLRKQQFFTQTIKPAAVLGYLWLFEYNVPLFLVKLNFSASPLEARILMLAGVVYINHHPVRLRWETIRPLQTIQLVISVFSFLKIRARILNFINLFQKLRRLVKRFYSRRRRFGRPLALIAYSGFLVFSKTRHYSYIEVDYRSLCAVLLPVRDFTNYYKYLWSLWINYWNYRTLGWKLVT
jgi:hypothetical protein